MNWPAIYQKESWVEQPDPLLPEAAMLRLDSSKARERLKWRSRLYIETALEWTVDWSRAWQGGVDVRASSLEQIRNYAQLDNE